MKTSRSMKDETKIIVIDSAAVAVVADSTDVSAAVVIAVKVSSAAKVEAPVDSAGKAVGMDVSSAAKVEAPVQYNVPLFNG